MSETKNDLTKDDAGPGNSAEISASEADQGFEKIEISESELGETSSQRKIDDVKEREMAHEHISDSPKVIFRKMAENDRSQNRRLSESVNGLASASMDDLVKNGKHQRGNRTSYMRFFVCTMGLLALTLSQGSRMIMNTSITKMVRPDMINKHGKASTEGSCPVNDAEMPTPPHLRDPLADELDEVVDASKDEGESTKTESNIATLNEGSIPTEDPQITVNDTILDYKDRFDWSIGNQQLLLGSFFFGYTLFMVFGGRLAEIYGAKYVIFLGVFGSAAINLSTPFMAHRSFVLLVCSRVLLGALQAGVFPGVYALMNKWLTMSEASIFAPGIKVSLRVGMLFGSYIPGIITAWPNVFYFTGLISLIWSILWLLLATSDPSENRFVSPNELARINRKKKKAPKIEEKKSDTDQIEMNEMGPVGKSSETTKVNGDNKQEVRMEDQIKKSKSSTPWFEILTSSSVIGLILVKLTFNFGLDFMAVQLPSYLDYVHHIEGKEVSV